MCLVIRGSRAVQNCIASGGVCQHKLFFSAAAAEERAECLLTVRSGSCCALCMGTVTLQSLDAHALEQAAHGRSVGFQYMPGAVPWMEAGHKQA